eukprot:jgi/Tetstr1/438493/TSEL_027048.t1
MQSPAGTLKCGICNRLFRTALAREQHQAASHQPIPQCHAAPEAAGSISPSPQLGPFPCWLCGRSFGTQQACRQHHDDSHVGLSVPAANHTPAPQGVARAFPCTVGGCSRGFKTKDARDHHQRDAHAGGLLPTMLPPERVPASLSAGQGQVTMLPDNHEEHASIKNHFLSQWQLRLGPQPVVQAILKIRPPQHLEARFQAYEAEKGSETAVRQFHGTLKTCQLGHDPTRLEPCIAPDCATCQIIKGGFKVSKAKPRAFQRYGMGIYTSPFSHKANDYPLSDRPRKAGAGAFCSVFVVRVVRGKCFNEDTSAQRHYPVSGYDSTQGTKGNSGGLLNWGEVAVYDDAAVKPLALIIYKLRP